MKLKNLFRQILPKRSAKHVTAIIVAGGSGSRMGSDKTKQMMELEGMPVVVRTILAFEKAKRIKDIIIVAKAEEKDIYKEFTEKYSLKKIRKVVIGGDTRQKSVLNGFKAISDRCDFVAIHDGARCLVTPEDIEKVLSEAEHHEAASAAAPAKDTVKITNADGFVESTPERSRVWMAQTPQIFYADLYRAAAFYALKQGFEATDDNSLVEYLGAKVKMVDCGYRNIKITTPEDIHIAQILLKEDKND
ncbi:MAG: 2-C-methyl-D-erythritol 4-phosphate cytidylyltransferase [Clostridia bacterium]|nr:2-C-methyl-D-erythritol 4-phosphate cytidylyltransferase [Clostridia bacterium]